MGSHENDWSTTQNVHYTRTWATPANFFLNDNPRIL